MRAALVPFSGEVAEEHLLRARDLIQSQAPQKEVPDLLASLYIIAGRRFTAERVRKLLWSRAVMESSTYREIEAKGYEKGLERGQALGARGLFTRLLDARFPAGARSLEALIARCSSEDLEAMTEVAATTSSLEEVRQALLRRLGE